MVLDAEVSSLCFVSAMFCIPHMPDHELDNIHLMQVYSSGFLANVPTPEEALYILSRMTSSA